MATNTCKSVIQYQSEADQKKEPFWTMREEFALGLFQQGKSEYSGNIEDLNKFGPNGIRGWIDHAAAQEFIDWVVANAPTHDVNIQSTSIEDLSTS